MTKTRREIQDTFLNMARTSLPKRVTVTDIVTACGINRNSFYYYFEDLPDMIEATITERILEQIDTQKPSTIDELMAVMEAFMRNNRNVCIYLYRTPAKNDLALYYHRVAATIVKTFLEEADYYGVNLTEQEKHDLVCFYQDCLIGLLQEWLSQNMKYDLRDQVGRMTALCMKIIKELK